MMNRSCKESPACGYLATCPDCDGCDDCCRCSSGSGAIPTDDTEIAEAFNEAFVESLAFDRGRQSVIEPARELLELVRGRMTHQHGAGVECGSCLVARRIDSFLALCSPNPNQPSGHYFTDTDGDVLCDYHTAFDAAESRCLNSRKGHKG